MYRVNIEGFLNYYDAQTRGRNEDYFEIIVDAIEQIEENLIQNEGPYIDTTEVILENMKDFNKTFTTMLMASGTSKVVAQTASKHFKAWITSL